MSTTPTTTTTTITVEGGTSPAPSDLQFSQGNKRIVDTGDDQYYLIDQIPDIDPNRVAITTLDYELVDESIAKDVIALDFFRDALFTMNWEREAEDLLELWSRSMSLKNAGLFLDIGWDLTEILIYVSAGINNAAVDSAKDAALEAISWQLREINQPYREIFSKFTACLASNNLIEERVDDITSYDDLSSRAIHYIEETMNLNETLSKRSSPSENINDAWEDMFNSLSEESEYSSELEAAINGSQLFLAIANPPDQQEMISSSIGSIEDVVKTKTTIHVIEQDYAYMRIDVVRKLRNLRAKFDQDEGTIGDLHFYNECVKTNFQMNALFYAAIAEYWKKISEHPANLLWDVLVQADEKAARYAELAENMKQTIYDTQNIRGMGWRVVEDRLESSVNVETEKGGSN